MHLTLILTQARPLAPSPVPLSPLVCVRARSRDTARLLTEREPAPQSLCARAHTPTVMTVPAAYHGWPYLASTLAFRAPNTNYSRQWSRLGLPERTQAPRETQRPRSFSQNQRRMHDLLSQGSAIERLRARRRPEDLALRFGSCSAMSMSISKRS